MTSFVLSLELLSASPQSQEYRSLSLSGLEIWKQRKNEERGKQSLHTFSGYIIFNTSDFFFVCSVYKVRFITHETT